MSRRNNNKGVMEAFVGLLDALVADSLNRVLETGEKQENSGKGLLNRKAAAEYLDISPPTLDVLLKTGEIKSVVIPGTSARRYTKRSLDNLIERQSKERGSNGINH